MKRRRQRESKRGFTLVELLVVISIIVLLMALLLPALSRARKQAQAVVCRSNLRQWGIISSLYASEHDGRLMHRWYLVYLREYLDDDHQEKRTPYLCPAAARCDITGYVEDKPCIGGGGIFASWWENIPETWLHSTEVGSSFLLLRSSYGANYYTSAPGEDQPFKKNSDPGRLDTRAKHWSPTNMKKASDIPLLFDCAGPGVIAWETDEPPTYEGDFTVTPGASMWEPPHNTMRYACMDRHGNGSVNMAFVDGSARRVDLKELWTLKWHAQYNTSGPWTKAGGVQPGDWPLWMRKFKDY